MKPTVPDLSKYIEGREKRYVTYHEGARLYSMPYYPFVHLVKEAKANQRIRKSVIVDLDILDAYIEKLQLEENNDV